MILETAASSRLYAVRQECKDVSKEKCHEILLDNSIGGPLLDIHGATLATLDLSND